MRTNLLDFTLDELREVVRLDPPYRVTQLFSGLQQGLKIGEISSLPLSIRDSLEEYSAGVNIMEALTSSDGSEKYLYELDDGNIIEGVFMPHDYGNTLCVSTQVGCRMGCAFCASGIGGLIRNLTPGEMLGQALAVNRRKGGTNSNRMITNLVLMGSGEPLDNYDNVVKFLRLVSSEKGINISTRNISLSTCGLCENIKRLADEGLNVTLSISLHATTDEARREFMPIANKYTISELMSAASYYFQKTGRRIIFEYSMIKGKNIDYFDAIRLKRLTKGFACHINLIMLNPVKEKHLDGCTKVEADRFLERLKAQNLSVTIRKSFGSDIAGACGQLRRSRLNSIEAANEASGKPNSVESTPKSRSKSPKSGSKQLKSGSKPQKTNQ